MRTHYFRKNLREIEINISLFIRGLVEFFLKLYTYSKYIHKGVKNLLTLYHFNAFACYIPEIFFIFFYVFGDHLGLYFRYDIEYNTLGVMTMEMEQGDQRGGLISLNLWQCLRFPHSPVFSRIRRFVLLLYSLDRTLQCMRCGGRPARFSTVQESHRSA